MGEGMSTLSWLFVVVIAVIYAAVAGYWLGALVYMCR